MPHRPPGLRCPGPYDMEVFMEHRRTSGSKVRTHKIGFNKGSFQHRKQARLEARRLLAQFHTVPLDSASLEM